MDEVTQQAIDISFNIKAIHHGDYSLSGIVRMSGTLKQSHVQGICELFRIDRQDGQNVILYLNRSSLFFYGKSGDLQRNYWGNVPFNPNSKRFEEPNGNTERAYLVPIQEMQLNPSHNSLVEKLSFKVEERLPHLVSRLEEIQINMDDSGLRRQFSRAFYFLFPKGLFSVASSNGSYYTFVGRPHLQRGAIPTLMDVKNMSINDLPQWARSYIKLSPPY